jgi:hypothetical protein
MFGRLIRVIVGFVLACLFAALTKVFFAFPPSELANLPTDIAQSRIGLALPVATHMAIFSAPFALVAAAFGEWRGWRDWTYYTLAGIGIAVIGFLAQYSSETGIQGWSITNGNYPFVTFLTTGFMGGLAYWLFSGRFANGATHQGHHDGHHGNRHTHGHERGGVQGSGASRSR